jgi:LmbE family N-acetylglucosaminyl deacetylase
MIYIPDSISPEQAMPRTTHLAIAAHHDDLEIFAFHGIVQCLDSDKEWFGGIVCTDGSKSPRSGAFANTTDQQMAAIRIEEQNRAADIARYSFVEHIGLPSDKVKNDIDFTLVEKLRKIILTCKPDIIYAHNPADRHATHVAIFQATIAALRSLTAEYTPPRFLGCEVWRDLDWLCDDDKVMLDVSGHEKLAVELLSQFESQVAGGKDYVGATIGRRRANATFSQSHSVDIAEQVTLAIDLMPLIDDPDLEISQFVEDKIYRFRAEVTEKLSI